MPRQLIKLLDDLQFIASNCNQGRWQPATDIYRTNRGWLVKMDLAGVTPDDVTIERDGNHLRVHGTRRDTLLQQGIRSYSLEISYSRFERSIELPNLPDEPVMQIEYQDGMLLIWLDQ